MPWCTWPARGPRPWRFAPAAPREVLGPAGALADTCRCACGCAVLPAGHRQPVRAASEGPGRQPGVQPGEAKRAGVAGEPPHVAHSHNGTRVLVRVGVSSDVLHDSTTAGHTPQSATTASQGHERSRAKGMGRLPCLSVCVSPIWRLVDTGCVPACVGLGAAAGDGGA